jgi:ABC-type multidrug transport system fused ATPase/permease subunit
VRVAGSLLLAVGVFVMLFREDWRIGLALTLYFAIALVVLNATRSIAVPHFAAERQANAALFGFIEERLSGLPDIRSSGANAYVMRRFYEALRELASRGTRAWRMGSLTWVTAMGVFAFSYVLAFAIGAALFAQGAITLGTVFLLFTYTDMLRRPLEMIVHQLQDLQKASASIGRIGELFRLHSQIVDGAGDAVPSGPLSVDLDGVSFAYADQEGDDMVLRDLALRLAPGTVLGVLGRTGSGKTTLARLLLRLFDPTAGTIRLGGADLRGARLAELRRRVAIVTQDVQLFHATVRDNLTMFDRTIPDERILEVLEDLGLWGWLQSLPKGLDSELAPGGSGLSAGEAQLVAFARVFLRDPGLVILDEASSRLDPATERLIERAIDRLLVNRTAVIIAHRLGTLHRADEVLILDGGRIAEFGDRERLARDPGSRFHQLLRTGLEEALA